MASAASASGMRDLRFDMLAIFVRAWGLVEWKLGLDWVSLSGNIGGGRLCSPSRTHKRHERGWS
jgi:hypothetical protein